MLFSTADIRTQSRFLCCIYMHLFLSLGIVPSIHVQQEGLSLYSLYGLDKALGLVQA